MEKYNAQSCNTLRKVFYTPIEAALRWCNLTAHESEILGAMGADTLPPPGRFPQWPCLRLNTERILDAIEHGDLPVGRDGKPTSREDHVAPARRTIRHVDLAQWMAETWTGAIPSFMLEAEAQDKNETLGTKERNILLTIIALLCKDAGYDYTKAAKTAGLIHGTAAKMDVSIGETTIENHLKKIPDALGTRTK